MCVFNKAEEGQAEGACPLLSLPADALRVVGILLGLGEHGAAPALLAFRSTCKSVRSLFALFELRRAREAQLLHRTGLTAAAMRTLVDAGLAI